MKKRLLSVSIAVFLAVSLLSVSFVFAHTGDDFDYGNKLSLNPFNHFNACYQWADFNCPVQKHHATAVEVCPECGRDEVKVVRNAGYNAHAETDWHYEPTAWNSYYGHD